MKTKTKTKTRIDAILCLVASSVLCNLQASAQEFRWKFAGEDQFSVSLTQRTTIETAIDKRSVKQETEIQLNLDWVVDSVDGETAQIKQFFRRIVSKTTMPGEKGPQTLEFDSANADSVTPESRRLRDSFAPLIDQEIQLTVSTRGEILDVTIPKETLDSLRKMPGSIQGRDAFSEDSLREMFMQAFVVFPEGSIAVGESWTSERQFQLGERSFQQNTVYTYQEASERGATFAITSELQVAEDAQSAGLEALQLSDQKATGSLVFDRESGNCLSSDFNLSFTTQIPYRDMQVISTVQTQSTTTMVRK